jgi:hypothetical protein
VDFSSPRIRPYWLMKAKIQIKFYQQSLLQN